MVFGFAASENGLNRSGLGPQGYSGALRVILGPEEYDQIILFKCLLIGQWHGVSDPKLEETLHDRFDALLFAGLDLHCTVRDETPHFGSRNARVRAGA